MVGVPIPSDVPSPCVGRVHPQSEGLGGSLAHAFLSHHLSPRHGRYHGLHGYQHQRAPNQ